MNKLMRKKYAIYLRVSQPEQLVGWHQCEELNTFSWQEHSRRIKGGLKKRKEVKNEKI